MKILVTGATGFIGNYVISSMLQKGYHVIATSSDEQKARLQDWFGKVSYIRFDIDDANDEINYFKHFDEPDILVHLAWKDVANCKANSHIKQTLPKHTLFLNNLIINGLKDLTVAGTCLEYGNQGGYCIEDMICNPDLAYAKAKNLLRKNLVVLAKTYNFKLKWLRLFYMYGDGQSKKSLYSQLLVAIKEGKESFDMSGGDQIRDYLLINEVAEIVILLATNKKLEGVINCCSGNPITDRNFVEDLLNFYNSKLKLNFGAYPYLDYEPMEIWGSREKLNSIIDYRIGT